MSTRNSARASELGQILMVGTTGFTVRKRTGVGMFIHFFLLLAMVVLGVSLLVYYKSFTGCILVFVIGTVFAMIAQNLEKIKKVKQSLEFMNALFSSALGKGHQFCCIVKGSGEIVFYNRPFQALFPAYMAQKERSIDVLLNLYHVSDADKEKLKGLMASNSEGSMTVTMHESTATTNMALNLTLEPIERPTGFFLLRGK